MATRAPERARTPSPSRVPLPGSPTYSYASTANRLSTFNLPMPPPPRPAHTVLTKADLEQSHLAYSELLATAKSYRIALASISTAASAFGCALEACARLKESRADSLLNLPAGGHGISLLSNSYTMRATSCTADHLLSASGVHHLIANHQQILSETVYRSFEVPLLHDLDKWRRDIEDADEAYQKEVAVRSREIRRLEKEGIKLHKQRRRDLSKFREHLVLLTGKLDGLSALHGDHAQGLLRESQEASTKILDASCSLVRAEVDIFESLARKGWTGGGLDDLLERGRDLFATDDDMITIPGGPGNAVGGATNDGTKLFSILPPKSILADSGLDSGPKGQLRERTGSDSLLVDGDRYQSLARAVKDQGDTESIFSDFNHSRGVRPFSPQPIRRQPTDVIMDPESLLHGDDEFLDNRQGLTGLGKDNTESRLEHDFEDQDRNSLFGEEDDENNDERNATLRPRKFPSPQDIRPSEEEGQIEVTAGGETEPAAEEEVVGLPWQDEVLRNTSTTATNDT
ncbi:putative phospholipid-binding protein [Rosellinia necatrix]|uniref:Putative phospholipid-binding protein n=1 Tax=Rosellinia necatrix TaxID=77044 RepID=A0A1W2TPB7_ROSNE|nr:putative phospholipid-binding protein [Rosellinia necatrix]